MAFKRVIPHSSGPYRVEVSNSGCDNCGADRTWAVCGPDDVEESVTFHVREDAQSYADALNEAYQHGVNSQAGSGNQSLSEASPPVPSEAP